jgi:hypothetical protein
MTTITPPVLMPCPFCGQLPAINSLGHVHHTADGCVLHDGAFTADQWNRRTPTPSPALPSEEMRGKLVHFLNAFKADPFSTGEDKVDRLLEILAAMQATPETGWQRMLEALEPFSSFAEHAIDDEGWVANSGQERICYWFGPSDFRKARIASDLGKAKPND